MLIPMLHCAMTAETMGHSQSYDLHTELHHFFHLVEIKRPILPFQRQIRKKWSGLFQNSYNNLLLGPTVVAFVSDQKTEDPNNWPFNGMFTIVDSGLSDECYTQISSIPHATLYVNFDRWAPSWSTSFRVALEISWMEWISNTCRACFLDFLCTVSGHSQSLLASNSLNCFLIFD